MIKPEKGSLDGFLAGSLHAIRTILSQIFLTTLLIIIIVVLIVSDFLYVTHATSTHQECILS